MSLGLKMKTKNGMIDVLRESSIRAGIASQPPLSNQFPRDRRVQGESIGVLPRKERLSRITSFRKLPGSLFLENGLSLFYKLFSILLKINLYNEPKV